MPKFNRNDWVVVARSSDAITAQRIGLHGFVRAVGDDGSVEVFLVDYRSHVRVSAADLDQINCAVTSLLAKNDQGKIWHDSTLAYPLMLPAQYAPPAGATHLDWLRAIGRYWGEKLHGYGQDVEVWLAVECGQAFVYERLV